MEAGEGVKGADAREAVSQPRPQPPAFRRYRVRPTFGPAETVLPKLYAARQNVRQLHTTMQCKHAQMSLLQGAEPTKVRLAGAEPREQVSMATTAS